MKEYITLYKVMKLGEEGYEYTVHDVDYDTECYFYSDFESSDRFDKALIELAKLLSVREIVEDEDGNPSKLTCDISGLIEMHIDDLKRHKLFGSYDIDDIMEDWDNIISGYVSESWMETFVKAMKGE